MLKENMVTNNIIDFVIDKPNILGYPMITWGTNRAHVFEFGKNKYEYHDGEVVYAIWFLWPDYSSSSQYSSYLIVRHKNNKAEILFLCPADTSWEKNLHETIDRYESLITQITKKNKEKRYGV